ncbi:MAG: Crp/Fnr family transcriptional regulator [Acidimicrobiales bacterium]
MDHEELLTLTDRFPTRTARPGQIIIEEDGVSTELLVLRSGTVEVRRGGQLVAVIDEVGATLGEVSMLLESPSTADVVARDEVILTVVDDPITLFAEEPQLALFIARQLADRLARVTDYLADLKDEFGDDGRLGLVPEIVSELLTWRRLTAEAVPSSDEQAVDSPPST